MRFRTTAALLALLLLPALASAQTFAALLRGVNERPTPNGSTAIGYVTATFNPATNELSVIGEFRNLTTAASAAHVHRGNRNIAGPVVQGITFTAATSGSLGPTTMTLSAADRDSLFNDRLYINVHNSTYPGGEIRGTLVPAPILDGNTSDGLYQTIASKQNANAGFGPNIDVQAIKVYPVPSDSVLFLAVQGRLDTSNDNAIGIFLNASGGGSSTGAAEGSPIGFAGAGSFLDGSGGGSNDDFAMDMEVDYALAINPGGGSSNIYVDAARYTTGTPTAKYLGDPAQSGTPFLTTGFAAPVIMAYNNASGFEMLIPFKELGVNTDVAVAKTAVGEFIQAFAVVASSSGYFSNVTVPGNASGTESGGNLGFNPNFDTLPGGPYVSTSGVLPVELVSFTAAVSGATARLAWTTASETNNAGFAVERRSGTAWEQVGYVDGAGTTAERHDYALDVTGLAPGRHAFRLRQVDLDGTAHYSATIEAVVAPDGAAAVALDGPNPFRTRTALAVSVREPQAVTVAVYDALGRRVAEAFRGAVDGSRRVEVDGAGLSAGHYVVVVEGERFRATLPLTVAR